MRKCRISELGSFDVNKLLMSYIWWLGGRRSVFFDIFDQSGSFHVLLFDHFPNISSNISGSTWGFTFPHREFVTSASSFQARPSIWNKRYKNGNCAWLQSWFELVCLISTKKSYSMKCSVINVPFKQTKFDWKRCFLRELLRCLVFQKIGRARFTNANFLQNIAWSQFNRLDWIFPSYKVHNFSFLSQNPIFFRCISRTWVRNPRKCSPRKIC